MRRILVLGLLLTVAACSSRSGNTNDPGFGPSLAIERFLQAANSVSQLSANEGQGSTRMADEIETMARLFGTKDGSVLSRYPRDEVEQRMFLIARIIEHDDYRLAGERAVPGRSREAIEVRVDLTTPNEGVKSVPFTVVRTRGGEWLIENIQLEAITGT